MEAKTLIQVIRGLKPKPGARILDVGCGDGQSTLRLAEAFDQLRVMGVDFSATMIENARERQAARRTSANAVDFRIASVTELDQAGLPGPFDIVLTGRCLINLPDVSAQRAAIGQIATQLGPSGHYIAIENFHEGHDEMNRARQAVGLNPIPIRWHNVYFRETEFCDMTAPHFEEPAFREFSSAYYFATRVIYSKMCQLRGEEPDYDHDIHRLAVDLPEIGRFSPIRMAILRRRCT